MNVRDLESAFDTAEEYTPAPLYCAYGTCALNPAENDTYCTTHARRKVVTP